ncbi:MAG: OmpA family protein [Bacteroides sp.]|nr:OmpA family protein [Bacteroides sp.]
MKASRLLTLAALLSGATALPAVAQDTIFAAETVSVTEYNCDDVNRYYSSWRDNWFIQLGAGINQPFVEQGIGTGSSDLHTVDRHKMTVEYNFGVGRWISPYLGLRLNALGGALHWDNPAQAGQNGWSKAYHANLNFELMWDMCNSIAGVNPNRPVSVIPFVGLGGDLTWKIRGNGVHGYAPASNVYKEELFTPRTRNWTLPVSAGIQFRFRLCKYVDFFAEARAAFYGDNWNSCAVGKSIEANVSALGGFNINIGGRQWGEYNECASASQIASLNNQVNDLRGELLATSQALAAAQAAAQAVPTKTTVQTDCPDAALLSTVRFKINSAIISPEEEVNVYNMAQWLKDNPTQKITVVGYADKDTGTADYNMSLSKKRAQAVADMLTKKYGISADRLNVKFDGSSVQPYDTNNWNRIVIFTDK